MELKGKKIGVALTGSFCTYKKVFQELEKLAEEGAQIQTIFSDTAQSIDSRFGKAEDFVKEASYRDFHGGSSFLGCFISQFAFNHSSKVLEKCNHSAAFWVCLFVVVSSSARLTNLECA